MATKRRSKLDYFPFFPKDCEADEAIRMMDDAQLGFWLRCVCFQWPNGSIPADPSTLALVLLGRGTEGGTTCGTEGGTVGGPNAAQRTAQYVAQMLNGPVGLRMKPHPTLQGRLADSRLLAEYEIAKEASTTNAKNAGAKRDDVAERNGDMSLSDPLFCSVSVSDEVEQWFESEFWPMYPRKVAKPKALKAARKHGETVEARARIMETLRRALPALSREVKPDGDFRPYPASWLNQEPWLNESPSAQPTPAPKPWKADW